MNLSKNISYLRKKSHWSQEDLAYQLGVSRQAVSKWESGLSQPDLEKIVKLSTLFHVSTDTLLKKNLEDEKELEKDEDEQENLDQDNSKSFNSFETFLNTLSEDEITVDLKKEEFSKIDKDSLLESPTEELFQKEYLYQEIPEEEKDNLQPKSLISLEIIKEYLDWNHKYATWMGMGVFLCIVSPAPLLLLIGLLVPTFHLETLVACLGVSFLLIFVAIAVGLFVHLSSQAKEWKWLEKEPFELTPNAYEYALYEQQETQKSESLQVALGVVLCVISPIPLILGSVLLPENIIPAMVGFLLCLVALGVFLFVYTNLKKKGYQVLLQQGEYTPLKKKQSQFEESIKKSYWLIITAIYFIWSFTSDEWETSWVIWPIAGICFGFFAKLIGPNGVFRNKAQ